MTFWHLTNVALLFLLFYSRSEVYWTFISRLLAFAVKETFLL